MLLPHADLDGDGLLAAAELDALLAVHGDAGADGLSREVPPADLNLHKISTFLQFFGGLVLGCTKTKFCKKIIKICV